MLETEKKLRKEAEARDAEEKAMKERQEIVNKKLRTELEELR